MILKKIKYKYIQTLYNIKKLIYIINIFININEY